MYSKLSTINFQVFDSLPFSSLCIHICNFSDFLEWSTEVEVVEVAVLSFVKNEHDNYSANNGLTNKKSFKKETYCTWRGISKPLW